MRNLNEGKYQPLNQELLEKIYGNKDTESGNENSTPSEPAEHRCDWNKMDNKPFYDTRQKEVLFEYSGSADIEGSMSNPTTAVYMRQEYYDTRPNIENGKTYFVEFNGEVYELVCHNYRTLGNCNINTYAEPCPESDYHNAPFSISLQSYGFTLYFTDEYDASVTSKDYSFKIYEQTGELKPIDKKFLPEHLQFGETTTTGVVIDAENVSMTYKDIDDMYEVSVPYTGDLKIVNGMAYHLTVTVYEDKVIEVDGTITNGRIGFDIYDEDMGMSYNYSMKEFAGKVYITTSADSMFTDFDAIKLEGTQTETEPIDEKYIPDTIARKSDIPESDGGPKLIFEGDIDFNTENNDGTTCYEASEAVNIPLEFGKVYIVKWGEPSESNGAPDWFGCIVVGTNDGYYNPCIGAGTYQDLDRGDQRTMFHFSANKAYYIFEDIKHFEIYELC